MKPFAHQEKATNEAVRNLSSCGYHALFMEVGTGKSKVILDTAMRMRDLGHIDRLLVCGPKSLAGTWKEQVALHCGIPHSFIVFDAQKAGTKKWQDSLLVALNSPFPIMFVNTEAFQVMPKALNNALENFTYSKGRGTMLVIDESSDIKGPKAQRSINLTKFGQKCNCRMIATGTEITNSVLDLYQQFEFLKPGFWGFRSFYFFKNYYAILEERFISGGRTFKEVIGFRKVNELQDRIAPYVSRARKIDCLDLPEKLYATLPVTMTGETARVYESLKKDLMARLTSGELVTVANKVALFTKFRQVTGGTLAGVGVIDEHNQKLTALIGELSDSSEQAIIWSCFTEELSLILGALKKAGMSAVRFDGQVGAADREAAIEGFRDGTYRFFVANPAAASQGLNLQNCHVEYWYSKPTQAKQLVQAEGRIHRSGQSEKCLYKTVVAEGTVDERVNAILTEKEDIMSAFRDGTLEDVVKLI